MPGLLADVNIEGVLKRLIDVCKSPAWQVFWAYCDTDVVGFEDLGLSKDASDLTIWKTCQSRNVILITANRNEDDEESLGTTIRRLGTLNDLPVLTISDVSRVGSDGMYRERVVAKLIEILLELDRHRGTGRLLLP